jgi:5-hydroxyisourate hydrolase-like protein (transthyretin family)
LSAKSAVPALPRATVIARASLCVLLTAGSISAAMISGTVTDADTKTPLGAMIVAAYTEAGSLQSMTTTDSQGRYVLGVPAGGYRVLAYDQTGVYATSFENDADSFETSPVVNVVDNVSGINFALRKGGSVTGLVSALGAGTPLIGMTIAAYNLSGTRRGFTQTDSQGIYSLVLPPGQYKIAAFDDSGSFAVRFFLDSGSFATATLVTVTGGRATAGINFLLELAGHLSGAVFDADTHMVLPAMTVIAYNVDGTTVVANTISDASGNFRLNVPAGSYKVVAADPMNIFAAGYVDDANSFTAEQAISVKSAVVSADIHIPLHRAGTVSGRVTDAAGAPLPGITVVAYNADGSQRTFTRTDSNGAYSLLLPPGSFRIGAYDESIIYATQFYPHRNVFAEANAVIATPGQTAAPVDFSLIRGARFTGSLIEQATGVPVAGVTVAVYDSDGNLMTTSVSDLSGNYALVLPPGSYRFVAFDNLLRYVTAYGGGGQNFENATVFQVDGSSGQRIDFALSRGVRVSGTVVDSALQPVSGVQIGALDLAGNRVASAMSNGGVFNLVLTPNTYKFLATDPLQIFQPIFFSAASTLAEATPVTVQTNGVMTPIRFVLARWPRRHAAPH